MGWRCECGVPMLSPAHCVGCGKPGPTTKLREAKKREEAKRKAVKPMVAIGEIVSDVLQKIKPKK